MTESIIPAEVTGRPIEQDKNSRRYPSIVPKLLLIKNSLFVVAVRLVVSYVNVQGVNKILLNVRDIRERYCPQQHIVDTQL